VSGQPFARFGRRDRAWMCGRAGSQMLCQPIARAWTKALSADNFRPMLAVNDPETYPRERLEAFAAAALGLARR
jgi:hypothetical protein